MSGDPLAQLLGAAATRGPHGNSYRERLLRERGLIDDEPKEEAAPMPARHPATQHLLDLFAFEHLPDSLQAVSKPLHAVAHRLANDLNDGPELSAGLRKLLEAKDCLVRQRVIDLKAAGAPKPVNTPEPELTDPPTPS
jgi:hypothetical protein